VTEFRLHRKLSDKWTDGNVIQIFAEIWKCELERLAPRW
jgi:hypothetical protein